MMKASKLTKNQVKTFRGEYTENGETRVVVASVRYDDQCGNGHNTFSVTGTVYGPHGCARDGVEKTAAGKRVTCEGFGCVHDDIARAIPALAPLLKWHLCSSDGPMHYPCDALFLAGTRDCWGMEKGEKKPLMRRNGEPYLEWMQTDTGEILHALYDADKYSMGDEITLRAVQACKVGEGKARELYAARSAAIWPDATDAELSVDTDKLRAVLMARLPGLMVEFRAAVESLGFEW